MSPKAFGLFLLLALSVLGGCSSEPSGATTAPNTNNPAAGGGVVDPKKPQQGSTDFVP